MCYLWVRMINLFPFIIYVIKNVIYVSVNFELRPIRLLVNLSPPKLAPSVHSYTLWMGMLINLSKLEAEVHACFSSQLSLANKKKKSLRPQIRHDGSV